MKKTLNVTLFSVLLLTLVGCSTIHNNKGASENMPAAVVCPMRYQVITEIGNEPISATVTGHNILKIFKFGIPNTFADNGDFGAAGESTGPSMPLPLPLPSVGGDPYAKYRQAAVYIACEENKCDSLMDARYTIVTKDYLVYEQVTCTVTGIPVKVKGYKPIEPMAM